MSIAESIKEAVEEHKKRVELMEYGDVTFRIVNGKVRRVNFSDAVLVDQGEGHE